MDRKRFLATGAAAAASAVLPTQAIAATKMHSKFARHLHLRHDGQIVEARGPIGSEVTRPVYFAVVITQGSVRGHGMSHRYHRDDPTWLATVKSDGLTQFRPGKAIAHGVSMQPESDEVYSYAWSMEVELV